MDEVRGIRIESFHPEAGIEIPRGLVDLVDDIEARVGVTEQDRRGRVFMIDACRTLALLLPSEAAEWLRVARAFAAGDASEQELTDARVAAWRYLGPRSCDFGDAEVSAVRAVICVLFPDARRDDWADVIHVFVEFCLDAGADPELLHRHLRHTFADLLD